MSFPPKDVPASRLWSKLCETPAPSEVVDFPRRRRDGTPIGQVRIMVLPQRLHDDARERAARAIEKKGYKPEQLKNDLLAEVQGDQTAKELLALACHEVDPNPGTEGDAPRYARVFPNGDAVGDLTADEINVLFTSYLMVQAKYGPYINDVATEEELDAWIRRLAEGGSAHPLASFSWRALVQLSMLTAQRAYKLATILTQHSSSLSISESDRSMFAFATSSSGKLPDDDSETGPAELDTLSIEEAANIAEDFHRQRGRID
jgi:hypothetical protein